MSEMVERVARAMQRRAKEPLGNLKSLEPVQVGSLGDAWPHLARAAIEAICEPDAEMIRVGAATYENGDPEDAISPLGLKDAWRAMIDAVLK